jgi:hypothetical protein
MADEELLWPLTYGPDPADPPQMDFGGRPPVTTVQAPQVTFDSPPYFSAHWLGCDPRDGQPRLVQCFGPAVHDDDAAGQAAMLGLESVMLGNPPPLSSVCGEYNDQRLVLYGLGHEVLLRSDPLPVSLATVLQWRAEVLLVWVDRPLKDPRTELALVGLHHVWTGIALVQSADPHDLGPPRGWVQ